MKAFKSYCLIKNDSCSSLSKPTYFLQLNHGKNLKVNNFNKQNLLYKLNPNSKQQLLHQNEIPTKNIGVSVFPSSVNVEKVSGKKKARRKKAMVSLVQTGGRRMKKRGRKRGRKRHR